MISKQRNTQIDAYRAIILIHIVCFVHVFTWYGLLPEVVRSMLLFEMPAIFFIAGASQRLKSRKENTIQTIKNRIKRVLIPFYIFLFLLYIFLYLFTFVLPNEPNGILHIDITKFKSYDIIKTLLTGGCEHIPFYGYTWFISCYMIVLCSLPIQRFLLKRIPGWIYMSIFFLLSALLTNIHFPLGEYEIKNIPVYNFFFIAGYLYYRNYKSSVLYIIWFVSFAITFIGFAYKIMMPMQSHKFPADIYFLIFSTVALSTLSLLLRKIKIPYDCKILKIWNIRGYNIYLYQVFTFYIVTRFILPLLDGISNEVILFLILSFTVFALSTVMSYATYFYERKTYNAIMVAFQRIRSFIK